MAIDIVRVALAAIPANTRQVSVVVGDEKAFVVDRSAKILVDKISLHGTPTIALESAATRPDEVVASALVSGDERIVDESALPPEVAAASSKGNEEDIATQADIPVASETDKEDRAASTSSEDSHVAVASERNGRSHVSVTEISPELVVEAMVLLDDGMSAVSHKIESLQTHSESVTSTRLSGWMSRLGQKAREVSQQAFAHTQLRMADVASSLKVETELLAGAAKEKALRAAVILGDRAAVLGARTVLSAPDQIPVVATEAVRAVAGTVAEISREAVTTGAVRTGNAIGVVASGVRESLEEKVRADLERTREMGSTAFKQILGTQSAEKMQQLALTTLNAGNVGVAAISDSLGTLYERTASSLKNSQLLSSQSGIPPNVTLDKSASEAGKKLFAVELETMSYRAEGGLTVNPSEADIFSDLEEAIASLPDTGKFAVIATDARVIEADDISGEVQNKLLRTSESILADRGVKDSDRVRAHAGELNLEAQLFDGKQIVAIVSESDSTLVARFVDGELEQAVVSQEELSAFELAYNSLLETGELASPEVFAANLDRKELLEIEL
ncbi:MAG: hypothetical protein AAGB19_18285, partial [Cyanobacteria bacterium P01_F01_bin.3]